MSNADVIVVGLGAVGSAAAYQLAKRGARVLGLDRFRPPHDRGSSHGETRITRQGVGEGEAYVPLAIRSHEIWRELEAVTGASLLNECGLLVLGPSHGQTLHHGKPDFARLSEASAVRFGVPHEMLNSAEIAARYPQFGLAGDEIGYFEPGGGLLHAERCVAAQLGEASRLGAELSYGARVASVETSAQGARVRTETGVHEAAKVVLCAGAWTPRLVQPLLAHLVLQPQALHWFAAEDPASYAAGRFPTFIWMHGTRPEDAFYGFPIAPGAATAAVKVATERFETIADPDGLEREVPAAAARAMLDDHLRGRLHGLGAALRSVACIYTRTPDADFVIDAHPVSDRLLIASACSGHGFKHSAAVGELLARMALEGASAPAAFRLDRPGAAASA
jgi:sarcosine oxidase